ncbi:MAG: protein kinase [Desulfuromonadales bacterium]|nr:protein kinase [Desulfuromonadales bacterium]
MLEAGKQISIYKIKEVLSENSTHTSCLAEDHLINRTILLKIYPVEFLETTQQRDEFAAQFEKLSLLEHPSIAPVFDSGYSEDYFYYSTSYKYQIPLLAQTTEALSNETILRMLRELATALDYAAAKGLVHGHLGLENLFIGEEGQVVIADFGVTYILNSFLDDKPPTWTETETVADLGRLQLQLRPASIDSSSREGELLDGIENQPLQQFSARFFPEHDNYYRSVAGLLTAIDELLQLLAPKTDPASQHETMQPDNNTEITRQQLAQLLPHVRELMAEKNHCKALLDEALIEHYKIEGRLRQTQQELDQANMLQLETPQRTSGKNWKQVISWALVGFILGVILSWSYGSTLVQKNIPLITPASSTDAPAAIEPVVVASSEKLITPELPEVTKPAAKPSKKVASLIPLIAEQSAMWMAAGDEFSTNAASEVLTADDRRIILSTISQWADSWSQQNFAAYLYHYSDSFIPAAGISRQEWLQTRKLRLQRPEWIKIAIDVISLSLVTKDRVEVKFQQKFRSNAYHDQILKSMELLNETAGWKILTERSLGK